MSKRSRQKSIDRYLSKKLCYESHPVIEVAPGMKVYGGSASYPAFKGADIYVALDSFATCPEWCVPWEGKTFISYPITDMSVPKNPESFKKLVGWLIEQMKKGLTVHIGCMAGHGRTGLLISALVKVASGNKNAIEFVREKYCHKAVESSSQIKFLHKEFGINCVKASKESYYGEDSFHDLPARLAPLNGSVRFNERYREFFGKDVKTALADAPALENFTRLDTHTEIYSPVEGEDNIWGL